MKNIKSFTIASIIILVILLIIAYIFNIQNTPPIKIGFIATLSGQNSDIGVASRNGILLAVKEINQNNGINGHKIEVVIKDDEFDKDKAKQHVETMVKEKIPVVFGDMTSQIAELAVPYANSNDILFITSTVSNPKFTGQDDNFMRIVSGADKQGQSLAKEMINQGLKNVAIITDSSNASYTSAVKKTFLESFLESKGKILFESDIPADAVNFNYKDLAKEIVLKNPDGIIISASAERTALLCQNISTQTSKKYPLFFSAWAMTNLLLSNGGQAVEGANIIEIIDINSTSPKMSFLRKTYMEVYGEKLGSHAIRAYDSAVALFEALKSSKNLSVSEIKSNMINRSYNGANGKYSIDANGDFVKEFIFFKIENNNFELVK